MRTQKKSFTGENRENGERILYSLRLLLFYESTAEEFNRSKQGTEKEFSILHGCSCLRSRLKHRLFQEATGLTETIIAAALEVHRDKWPGLACVPQDRRLAKQRGAGGNVIETRVNPQKRG